MTKHITNICFPPQFFGKNPDNPHTFCRCNWQSLCRVRDTLAVICDDVCRLPLIKPEGHLRGQWEDICDICYVNVYLSFHLDLERMMLLFSRTCWAEQMQMSSNLQAWLLRLCNAWGSYTEPTWSGKCAIPLVWHWVWFVQFTCALKRQVALNSMCMSVFVFLLTRWHVLILASCKCFSIWNHQVALNSVHMSACHFFRYVLFARSTCQLPIPLPQSHPRTFFGRALFALAHVCGNWRMANWNQWNVQH